MDKAEQEREDELYALLEKAVSDERLCVSEELIQRTLQGVQDGPKEKPHRRYSRVLHYACAAAAVVVLVIGGGILRQGGLLGTRENKTADMEPMAPYGEQSGGAALEQEGPGEPYREMSDGMNKIPLSNFYRSASDDGVWVNECVITWQMKSVTVSAELAEALSSAGYIVTGDEAEYWELTQENENVENEGEDGKQEIISALKEMQREPKVITSATPLYKAVRVQTEEGMLWVLLGEELYLLIE